MKTCSECSYETKLDFAFNVHTIRKHLTTANVFYPTNPPDRNKCADCLFSSDHKLFVMEHVRRVHSIVKACGTNAGLTLKQRSIGDFFKFKCSKCQMFSYSALTNIRHFNRSIGCSLNIHPCDFMSNFFNVRERVKLFQCDKCSFNCDQYCYLKIHNLRKHIIKGHENCWFGCTHCPKKFQFKSNLRKHISYKHTDRSPKNWFSCEHCSYKCNFKVFLIDHAASEHMTKERINWLQCGHCSREVFIGSNLRQHILCKHTEVHAVTDGRKLLKLQSCSMMFKASANLQKHVSLNISNKAAIKRFKCRYCSQQCISQDALEAHVVLQHSSKDGVILFECKRCAKKFRVRSYLMQHILLTHTKKSPVVWD